MKPVVNAHLYPRPYNVPRVEPEGRCCEALAFAEQGHVVTFERGAGAFTIPDPQALVPSSVGLLPTRKLAISFCPFCGFHWNERAAENRLLVEPKDGKIPAARAGVALIVRTLKPGEKVPEILRETAATLERFVEPGAAARGGEILEARLRLGLPEVKP